MKWLFVSLLMIQGSTILAQSAAVTEAHRRLVAAELKLYGQNVLMAATVHGMNYPTERFVMSCKDRRLTVYSIKLPKTAKVSRCQVAGTQDNFKMIVASTSGIGLYYNGRAWTKMSSPKLPKLK